jgi:2'-hydroxyisoflavone reductase
VIDTCGNFPRVVRQSAELLADAVETYCYVSSISAYADLTVPGIDEDAPLATMADETVEEITGESFGPLKVLCERTVEAVVPDKALVIRPGLIVGPHDHSNRFTYWVHRVAAGGDVLAPGTPEQPIQFIVDVRDLAEWMVRMCENRGTGTYNAKGPDYPLTMGDILAACKAESGSDARIVWADEEFLKDAGVGPWIELPLWLPPSMDAINSVHSDKAWAAGLTFRPIAATVRATLAWDRTLPPETERRAGMKPEREAELLAQWEARAAK